MLPEYTTDEPTRAAIDALPGVTLLEFGSPYCGHCRRAEPLVEHALTGRSDLRHVRIFDGRGRPLGRSFGVKLWPTLVVLEDGVEKARFVRPQDAAPMVEALKLYAAESGTATA